MGDPRVYADLVTHDKQQRIIDGLVQDHYSIVENYFTPNLVADLLRELQDHLGEDRLHAARIGKDHRRVRIKAIRGDSIRWLDGTTATQLAFLDEMELLRLQINRQLFLSLVELESHFAYYPPGTGYQRHLDSFNDDNLRRISFAAYLNPAWRKSHGGELLIYGDDAVIAKVPPVAGTLVCFVSEEIAHQVSITQAGRASIAGWFRVRDIGAVII